jgi:hypothetical protein
LGELSAFRAELGGYQFEFFFNTDIDSLEFGAMVDILALLA